MKRYIISSENTDRIQFAKELESELFDYSNMDYHDLLDLAMEGDAHAGIFVARSKEVDRDTLLSLFDYFLTHPGELHLVYHVLGSIIQRPDVLHKADYNYMLSLNNKGIDWSLSISSNLPDSVYYQIIERYSDDPECKHYVHQAYRRLNEQ